MAIDFKEIPSANKGGGQQDLFELFARDFLQTLGYKIIRSPYRGADAGKDLIVSETKKGIGGDETIVTWLVSCKHYASSGKAVSGKDEPDILDRVKAHNCDGFIGVYSTLPSSSLSNKLYGLTNQIKHIIFDYGILEKKVIEHDTLFMRFFPKSYKSYSALKNIKPVSKGDYGKTIPDVWTEEDLIHVSKTAFIIIEIERIKEEYWKADWNKRDDVIGQLGKFVNHNNKHLAKEVIEFLSDISEMTRTQMPYSSAGTIHWTVLSFFPGLYNERDRPENIEIAKQCLYLGKDIVYDSFIHLRKLAVAMWGLTTIKYIYREAKRNNVIELINEIQAVYDDLEVTLNRPERNDLDDAQEMLKIFRKDLIHPDISFPRLPRLLMKRIKKEELEDKNI